MDVPDLTPISWRAWYTRGRRFDSTQCSWEELPPAGALGFIVYARTRLYVTQMQGKTWFWKEIGADGRPYYCYDDGCDAQISDEAWEFNRVKRGKWVQEEEMVAVSQEMREFMDIAPNESTRIDNGTR